MTHRPCDEGPAVLTLSKKKKKRLLDPAGTDSKDRSGLGWVSDGVENFRFLSMLLLTHDSKPFLTVTSILLLFKFYSFIKAAHSIVQFLLSILSFSTRFIFVSVDIRQPRDNHLVTIVAPVCRGNLLSACCA